MKDLLCNLKKNRPGRRRAGQSASELAIFGTILIFVIGLIVQAALSAGQSQNNAYKALRTALYESWKTAKGNYSPPASPAIEGASAARNSASVLFVEDRLSVSSDKFGHRNRVPLVTSGSGTFTSTLFMNTDWLEYESLPMFDVIVNGMRFPLHAANFKEVDVRSLPPCANGLNSGRNGACWAPECYKAPDESVQGCGVFFKIVPQHPFSEEWCDRSVCPWRFDLDLDGVEDPRSVEASYDVAWQWLRVVSVDDDIIPPGCDAVLLPEPWEVRGMSKGNAEGGNESSPPLNLTVEIDQDLRDEQVLDFDKNAKGLIHTLRVIDYQEGDIDMTYNTWDKIVRNIPEPGIEEDVTLFTDTKDGTSLNIDQNANQYISRQFVEQDDSIGRIIRLSNQMQILQEDGSSEPKWCDSSSPVAWTDTFPPGVRGLANPFSIDGKCHTNCGCTGARSDPCPSPSPPDPWPCPERNAYLNYRAKCFTSGSWKNNYNKNCYEVRRRPRIFIRSSILNRMGHIWQWNR